MRCGAVLMPQDAVEPHAGIAQGGNGQEHVLDGRRAILGGERAIRVHRPRIGHDGDHRLGRAADRLADDLGNLLEQGWVVDDHERGHLFVAGRRRLNARLDDPLEVLSGDGRGGEVATIAVTIRNGVE